MESYVSTQISKGSLLLTTRYHGIVLHQLGLRYDDYVGVIYMYEKFN